MALAVLGDYTPQATFPPTLILGYPQLTDRAITLGVAELAAAIRTSSRSSTVEDDLPPTSRAYHPGASPTPSLRGRTTEV